MTPEQLIEKLRFSLNFLGISGGEYMTVAMNRAEIETLIAILEEYQKGETK